MEHCHARVRRYIISLSGLVGEGQANLTRHGAYPLYNPSMSHRESREDIETLGEYCADTHSEYIKLPHQRWIDMTALVHQIATTENRQASKSLADLAYQVRQSTSFRNLLAFIYPHQQTRVTKIVGQIGKISRFYRCALTIIQVAAKFCKDVSYICVKTLGFPKRTIGLLSSRRPIDLASRLPVAARSRLQREAETANRFLRRWRQYVVHAEMQLLLFYEAHADIRLVHNYIGISKRSCYLCAAFIRFHGQFVMEGAHQQLYSLWTIPLRIAFQTLPKEDNFKRALSSLCDDVQAKVNAISARSCYRFPFHMESVANFSRASLLSNGATAEVFNLGVTVPNDGVLREEPPLILDTLLPDGAPIEGQRNTVSRKSAECSFLGTPATLTEEMTTGDGEVVTDSLPHGTEATSERSKGTSGKEAHSQENLRRRRRRRRRRRSNARGTALAPNRRYNQINRNGAQHKKRRHRHEMQSNVAQDRKQKRTFDGGIGIAPKIRKGTKTLSGRETRGTRGDGGVRYRSTRAKLHSEFENDEMCGVYLIGICMKAVVDFFRGVLAGW
jgi:hypothetical protein